jgi:hypothetical protein
MRNKKMGDRISGIKAITDFYALGNTQIQLLDVSKGTVKLFTDSYDWDYHNAFINGKPQGTRDNLIYWERKRVGLNDTHGFPLIMYGIWKN